MRIARFSTGDEPRYAIVEGEGADQELVVLTGDPLYTPGNVTGERVPLTDEVRLLAPVIPRSKVVCLGRNYAAHVEEMTGVLPPAPAAEAHQPLFFLKPNTAVIGPDDPIVLPNYSNDVQVEGELAVVIGKLCKSVLPEHAASYIYGFTVANDVTARDLQSAEDQWFRAKAFDGSLPLGPWIETALTWDEAEISTSINGRQVQYGRTADMLVGVEMAVALASEVVTLLPGDVVLTGTPAGVTRVDHADVVEVAISGLGELRNPVIRRAAQ